MDGVSRVDIDRLSHQNAMRHFHFDPFASVPKAEATVGALRAKASGHDVSIRARGKRGSSGTLATGLAARFEK